MADIPSPLTYATITGKFSSLLADSADAGLAPDLEPISGTVTITPSVSRIFIAGTPDQMAFTSVMRGTIVNGLLYAQDGVSQLNILATDSPGINPVAFQYTAVFNLTGVNAQPAPVVFNAPGGTTVALTGLLGVLPAPAVQVIVSETTRIAAEAAAAAAAASAAEAATYVGGQGGAGVWGAITGTIGNQADLTTQLNLRAPKASPAFTGTPTGITKAHVGLANVDNTTDAGKPVSAATQTALNLKADDSALAAKANASAVSNVNNTSDAAKPVSTAQQAALDAKADLVGGVIPTSQLPAISLNTRVTVGNEATMLALTSAQVQEGDLAIRTDGAGSFMLGAGSPSVLSSWVQISSPTAGGTISSVNGQSGPTVVLGKADVGLGNVDNTSDANKPISTAAATALIAKASLASPAFTGTPTGITKAHVGLSSVDNTSDASKPVSTATQTALNGKANTIHSHGNLVKYVRGNTRPDSDILTMYIFINAAPVPIVQPPSLAGMYDGIDIQIKTGA